MLRRRYSVLAILICCGFFVEGVSVENETNYVSRGFSARTMLEKIASSLMSRAGSSSQVLSLNITNLLILVLLKALIFAAGSVGASSWKGGHGRNSEDDEEGIITDTEMLLYLGYISGSPGNHKCLQNVACHRPKQAAEYVKAGKLLLKTVHAVPNFVGDYTDYELSLAELTEATVYGMKNDKCDLKYQCASKKGSLIR